MENLNLKKTSENGYINGSDLFAVAQGINGLKTIFVNLYFIETPDGGWVMVDTGVMGNAGKIKKAIKNLFGEYSKPKAILLTHGHFDHVGNIKTLAQEWQVPVYAHPMEMPYITGRAAYPPADPTVGGGAMAYFSWMYPKRPVNLGNNVFPLPQDGSVPELEDWIWVFTPGHSPGHVSFYRPTDQVLLSGDAVITRDGESAMAVLSQKTELHGPPAYFTINWEQAKDSVLKLADLKPKVIAAGHGLPVRGDQAELQLHTLAEYFDQLAVPDQGRYVYHPVQADENGITYLPPAPENEIPKAIAAAGLLTIAGIAAYALTRRSKNTKLDLHGPAVRDRSYYEEVDEKHIIEDEHYDDEDIYKDDPNDPLGNPRAHTNNYP